MMLKRILRTALIASFILSASLNIHPSFATAYVDDETNFLSVSKAMKIMENVRNLLDDVHGIEINNPTNLTIQQSDNFFFENIPNDVALHILVKLCNNQTAFQDLEIVALTCKQGYHLVQNISLWEPLKQTYFGHLPKEYIEVLIKDKKEKNPDLACALFQQLLTHQKQEIQQLRKILSNSNFLPTLFGDQDDEHPLYQDLSPDFKAKSLKKLQDEQDLIEEKSLCEGYFDYEEILNRINSAIIRECINFIKITTTETIVDDIKQTQKNTTIDLKGTLTRLPVDGALALQKKIRFRLDRFCCA